MQASFSMSQLCWSAKARVVATVCTLRFFQRKLWQMSFRPCLVGLLTLAFGPKSQKPNQRGCFWRVLFQKQLLFRSSFLKAGLTLFLTFGFLLFEIGGIKSSSIVVSREIKIKGIFYTCLTKQVSAFLQLTAHSSFFTTHSLQQFFPTATAQLNRA